MAWTNSRTYVFGEIWSALLANAQVRDNFRVAARVLGRASYDPAGATTTTTSSTSLADVDATNLAVTFTAGHTGTVLVSLSAEGFVAAAGEHSIWGLRDGTTSKGELTAVRDDTTANRRHVTIKVTGLTHNVAYTFKWAHRVTTGTHVSSVKYGSTDGPAVMTVWSVEDV